MNAKNTKIQKIKTLNENREDILRDILNEIPNKNSLYRAINLPVNYLNLKSFLNKKEKLKEKSEIHLLQKLNLNKIVLCVDFDELTDQEVEVLENLLEKMFDKFKNFADTFKNERKKSSPKDISENDIQEVKNLINNVMSYDIEDELKNKKIDIDLFDEVHEEENVVADEQEEPKVVEEISDDDLNEIQINF